MCKMQNILPVVKSVDLLSLNTHDAEPGVDARHAGRGKPTHPNVSAYGERADRNYPT